MNIQQNNFLDDLRRLDVMPEYEWRRSMIVPIKLSDISSIERRPNTTGDIILSDQITFEITALEVWTQLRLQHSDLTKPISYIIFDGPNFCIRVPSTKLCDNNELKEGILSFIHFMQIKTKLSLKEIHFEVNFKMNGTEDAIGYMKWHRNYNGTLSYGLNVVIPDEPEYKFGGCFDWMLLTDKYFLEAIHSFLFNKNC